jgi:thiol-disulfide isomerase/thioredoxin
MRILLFSAILAGFTLFTSCKQGADNTYTIQGTLRGADSGWAYLYYYKQGQKDPITDSAKIAKGSFTFKDTALEPMRCHLSVSGANERLTFFVEPGTVTISGSVDTLGKATITGGPTQVEYAQFVASGKTFDDQEMALDSVYEAVAPNHDQHAMDSLMKVFKGLDSSRKVFDRQYIAAHPASYVSAYQIQDMFSYNPDVHTFDSTYFELDPKVRASGIGERIAVMLAIAKRTDVGQPIPDFTQNDTLGRPVTLSKYAKGKVVLVDFWASWCGPCRAENPNVRKAYKAYHGKGFDILSISLDDKKEPWLQAIQKDTLDWTHVSDLLGWKNAVAVQYGIQGIPMNFLIDRDGKIVAKGLRGKDLDDKLATLLK